MKIDKPLSSYYGLFIFLGLTLITSLSIYGGNSTQDITPLSAIQPTLSSFNPSFQKPDEGEFNIFKQGIDLLDGGGLPSESAHNGGRNPKPTPGISPTSVPTTSSSLLAQDNLEPTPIPTTGTQFGTIFGKINTPEGILLPPDFNITLEAFDNANQQLAWSETTTCQEDGSYLFSNVSMPTGWIFRASVIYNQVSFNSEASTITDNFNLELPITIYEISTDSSFLTIDRLHIFIHSKDNNTIQVVELFTLSNPSNKAIISSDGQPVLKFEIPEVASNLTIKDGKLGDGRFVQIENGFGDRQTILPGIGQTLEEYSFEIPSDYKTIISIPVFFPIRNVFVMIPALGIDLGSSQLIDSRQLFVEGHTYNIYTASNLKEGSIISFQISGTTDALLKSANQDSLLNIGIGASLLFVAVFGIGIYILQLTQKRKKRKDGVDSSDEDVLTLIDSIAALDNLHKAGKLNPVAFQQRRQELKRKLFRQLQETGALE